MAEAVFNEFVVTLPQNANRLSELRCSGSRQEARKVLRVAGGQLFLDFDSGGESRGMSFKAVDRHHFPFYCVAF
jgi:hypothetical protein